MTYREELVQKYGTQDFDVYLTPEETDKLFDSQHNDVRVSVSYPDGKGAHDTTIGELKDRFKEEGKEWLRDFINGIMSNGVGYTRFGEYRLIN